MAYGAATQRPLVQATGTPIISPVKTRQIKSAQGDLAKWFPFALVVLVLLYAVYAFLEQGEKLRSAIKPENIAVNLRNILVMLATVVLGINFLKIAAAKCSAWFGNVPVLGPASDFFVHLMGGV
jgi:hypothetical protein